MCLYETYSKVCIGKHLFHTFPIQCGLQQGNAVSPLLISFALEHAIRKVQAKQEGFKLNGQHQPLVCADVNLLIRNVNTLKESTEALLVANCIVLYCISFSFNKSKGLQNHWI
jgi:hypothetical protein